MNGIATNVAVATGLAFLELDAASVGPLLLSRPFVVAPLTGWFLGNAQPGIIFAILFEALTLEELPLGGCLHVSASIAAGVSTWLCVGIAVPLEAAFLCGIGAGWVHALVERRLRRTRAVHVQRVEMALAHGLPAQLGAEVSAALALQAVTTFTVAMFAYFISAAVVPRYWHFIPQVFRIGVGTAFVVSIWIGAGSLTASLWRRT